MKFEQIGEVIDFERLYQQMRWGHLNESDGTIVEDYHSVGDYVCLMENYLLKAKQALGGNLTTEESLHELRKVVALGVACFEEHGVPERDLSQPVVNVHDGGSTRLVFRKD